MINSLVTIGPNSANTEDIKEFSKFTKLFRLNGSHNTISWHKSTIELIRNTCPGSFIMVDIPGIKPRTANPELTRIDKEQKVVFGKPIKLQDDNVIHIGLTKPLPNIEKSLCSFSINDGQFSFEVVDIGEGYITGKSRETFDLLPKKGINLPGSIYSEDDQYSVYLKFLENIIDLDIDALGLSFVQTSDIVTRVRSIRQDLVLVSKVENSLGLENCLQIAEVSDAIMIDRGDLFAEIGHNKFFQGVEQIAHATKALGKPLIMATENLESMISREQPSKSEVISLAHSSKLGVDCFMLSEETAISNNKHVIVSWLSKFLQNIDQVKKNDNSEAIDELTIWKAINNFQNIKIPALIMSKSGRAVSKFLSHYPDKDVFVLTNNYKVRSLLKLYGNNIHVIPVNINEPATVDILWNTITENKDTIFSNNSQVIAIYVTKYVNTPRANCFAIFNKRDFEI